MEPKIELQKKVTENGEEKKKDGNKCKKKQLGGVRTMPFILGESTFSSFSLSDYAQTQTMVVFG